ncbi:uncharacterized protein [Montipora capricornis]|uniref:uncharacterized protein isoform X2 n=1 Tax=Montipora foliosa TaxID=591990 RepID=UPI0035F1FE29
MMGQCFGTEEGGGFFRFKQKRGYDRFTRFAPQSKWRYADEHLLTEIQDPRSDDELDLSDVRHPAEDQRQSIHPSYASNGTTELRQGRDER